MLLPATGNGGARGLSSHFTEAVAHSANGPILAYITHMRAADSNSGSSSDELIHGEGGRRPLLRFAAILIACVTTTMMQAQEKASRTTGLCVGSGSRPGVYLGKAEKRAI